MLMSVPILFLSLSHTSPDCPEGPINRTSNGQQRAHNFPRTMSDSPAPDSPPPLIYLDSETERGESPEQKSALYQSLAAAIEHPNCATAAWIDTVGDFKNN